MSLVRISMAVLLAGVCLASQAGLASQVGAAEVTGGTSAVGRKAEAFTLSDFYGKSHSLAAYQDKKVLVLAFLGTECPLAKLYGPRLAELQKKFADKDVQFLAIDSNRQDAITEIAAYARTSGIAFPILKDLNNKVADQLGAQRTPEVFVLDRDRVVRYHGRIDDQYGVGYVRKVATESYVQSAVNELLAGKPVTNPETGVAGCFIGRVHPADAAAKVTYSNQVVRVLNKRCVECHRKGEVAPFAMTNYEEVSGWADTIAEVVRNQRMPPWHASPAHGKFSNDKSLPEEEKQILYQWAAAGAPEGDAKELPPTPTFPTGWGMPKDPDQVFYMAPKPYKVQAEGTVAYKYFVVDPGFKENKWIKAIEARPGTRSVVHHIIVFSRPKGARDDGRQQFLVGYAPGSVPLVLPPGIAKFVPAGSELVFQMHYTPTGSEQEDRSKVGFIYADPKEVDHLARTVDAINQSFIIPAGADNYQVESDSLAFKFDTDLIQLFPHMHLRGKSFHYEARYPDGKTEVLLDVPHYDFGWQLSYTLAEPKHLPKGTVLHCIAHFDNSANNLNNPDPKSTVRWGDQTWEEMMIGFFDIVLPLSQKDVQAGNVPSFVPGPEDIAKRLMQAFDNNHDGKITQDEVPLQGKILFFQLDANKDGKLDLEEITKVIKDRQKAGQGVGRRREAETVPESRSKSDGKPAT